MDTEPQTHTHTDHEIVVDSHEQQEPEVERAGGNDGPASITQGTGLATPPLDTDIETSRVPRKREREVSLEPSTPQSTSVDIDAPSSAQKDRDRRTPAKKNRVSAHLDSTAEQDEDTQDSLIFDESEPASRSRSSPPSRKGSSRTPPLKESPDAVGPTAADVSASPPHETKIRLISRGVKDLNWRSLSSASQLAFDTSGKASASDEQTEMDHEDEQSPPTTSQVVKETSGVISPTSSTVLRNHDSIVIDESTEGDDPPGTSTPPAPGSRTSRAGSPLPPASTIPGTSHPSPPHTPPPEPAKLSAPPLGSPRAHPLLPSALEDDVKSGQKRKLGDRSASERHVPEDERKGKRISPPPSTPAIAEESGAEETADAKEEIRPQLAGFMAYASASSPFAKVRGPNLFSPSSVSPKPPVWSPSASLSNHSSPPSTSPFAFSPSSSPGKDTSPLESSTTDSFTTAKPSAPIAIPYAHSPQKRTGFEAFASTSSPFASAAKRPKSPPPPSSSTPGHGHPSVGLGFGFGHLAKNGKRQGSPARSSAFGSGTTSNAFSAYASAGSAFGSVFGTATTSTSSASSALGSALDSPAREASPLNGSVRVGGGSDEVEKEESEKVSFGERLRASKDSGKEDAADTTVPKVELTEQEVLTGEEDEETVFQTRGKLFSLSGQHQWKERGTGTLKLNVRQIDGGGARLVMRKEAVYSLLLNAPLFKGMKCFLAQDPRYLRFSVLEHGTPVHYNLRVSNARIAEDLLAEIDLHIPTE